MPPHVTWENSACYLMTALSLAAGHSYSLPGQGQGQGQGQGLAGLQGSGMPGVGTAGRSWHHPGGKFQGLGMARGAEAGAGGGVPSTQSCLW